MCYAASLFVASNPAAVSYTLGYDLVKSFVCEMYMVVSAACCSSTASVNTLQVLDVPAIALQIKDGFLLA